MKFDKSNELFPSKAESIFLNHCFVSPMYGPAAEAEANYARSLARKGNLVFSDFHSRALHEAFGRLLQVSPQTLSFTRNSAEGLNLVANGYPFQRGDEVLIYEHDYPSNVYPWLLQERRGVKVQRIGAPKSIDERVTQHPLRVENILASLTPRTRIVALSHVQFTDGFALDLAALGNECRGLGIDLVVDGAQSVGTLPCLPESWGISALVTSGWKWLLGPVGAGMLYTSDAFREKVAVTTIGPDMMRQGSNYLDHAIAPWDDGRMFEYSTLSYSLGEALRVALEDIPCHYGVAAIRDEILRLQDLFLHQLQTLNADVKPVSFSSSHRSGILTVEVPGDPATLVAPLRDKGVVVSARGGLLRIAPHFYLEDEDIKKAATMLKEVLIKGGLG